MMIIFLRILLTTLAEMFTDICFQYCRGVLQKNAYKVLRWAVELGSVETVEVCTSEELSSREKYS